VMLCKNWCCSWCGSLLFQMGAASPSDAHLAGSLALLVAVVLPAASLSQMTELLVSSQAVCVTHLI
jgi:hypothetical protein